MANSIKIYPPVQKGKRIDYEYEIKGDWQKYFDSSIKFWAEYSENIEDVPASVAVLPLVGNVIVLAALLDARIYVDEIDQDFYECIPAFLSGYSELSPQLFFRKEGLVHAGRIVKNRAQSGSENILFFSGGVDAWSSLLTHLPEHPILLSIWGADIQFDNETGWNSARKSCSLAAEKNKLGGGTIHSTLQGFINKHKLDQFSFSIVNDNWWSAFQHSVGMMCLAAPYAYGKGEKLYFASSYSSKDHKDWGSYVIASDPKIDNHVRFCGCQVIHDGYEFSRHDKVKRICDHFRSQEDKPFLRVCFSSAEGTNCGTCEKCANTIMSILLSGEKPEDYGFHYDAERFPAYFAAGMQEMAREEKYAFLSLYYWIQQDYQKQLEFSQVPPELKLFYLCDLEMMADMLHVPCNKCEKNKELKNYLEEVVAGKNWLEQQWQNSLARIAELEAECQQRSVLARIIWYLKKLKRGKAQFEGKNER